VQIIIINRQKKIPIRSRAIKKIVLKALKILKANLVKQLTILFTDNKTIQELNYRFSGKSYPTDVLCFDLSSDGGIIADIVISAQKACENSRIFKTSPNRELTLYLIHGILHLLGFKDRRKKDRAHMQRVALQTLKKLKY
jgi:probable rRNA maturation factor